MITRRLTLTVTPTRKKPNKFHFVYIQRHGKKRRKQNAGDAFKEAASAAWSRKTYGDQIFMPIGCSSRSLRLFCIRIY